MEGCTHYSKVRLVYQVFRILMTTDEKHPLNAKQIQERLKEYYNLDDVGRRQIYEVQNLLEDSGVPIARCERKNDGVYLKGTISLCEIKMLTDVLMQSKLFTKDAKSGYLKRLYDFMPEEYRKILVHMPDVCAVYHSKDEAVIRYIDILIRSIYAGHQVEFNYVAHDIEMGLVLKHNMKRYRISPYMLYFSDNTCYLIGAEYEPDEGIDKPKHFRLDRIYSLEATDRPNIDIHKHFPDPSAGLTEYVRKSIDHYGDKEVLLQLDVHYSEKAMYIIRDKCGDDFWCRKLSDDHAIISFHVRTGPTLTGWLMQNAGFFKAIGPENVLNDVRAAYELVRRAYEGG